ncbi:lipoprotein signal peptidase [Streptomyces ruber]|uniref:Lipoprotein signal peptidase n=2 Tax=Streptomyces TaxID=1883 RepID=A0A918BI10_9ACTN|nr:signal peptidase II [Streptomyces ruber]GGQ67264.1 lipoprotein signal peptidase [Streptomyces ruber]
MAEAERIIGTPDTPGAAGAGAERSGGRPAAGERSTGSDGSPAADAGEAPASAQAQVPGVVPDVDGGTDTENGTERPRGKRRIAVLFAVAALAYALDLVSKMIVVAKLEHHAPIEIVGEWLRFVAIRNAGAAFGFGEAFTVIFTVIAASVIVVIIRLARKLYSLPWAVALGLLLGGALGNLTDRIFRAPGVFQGAVVDFIAPKGFAVFNLADSAIVCGGVLIVLLSFRGLDPDGTVHKD